MAAPAPAIAQDLVPPSLIPLGPGEPAGSRSSVLPPPSGSQNPVLPPPTGFRYAPGTQGQWGNAPANPPRHSRVPPPATRDLAALVTAGPDAAPRIQVETVSQIGPAVARCWQPPVASEGAGEAGFTLRFSLRRNGTVIATPRVTWRAGMADADAQKRMIDSGLAALAQCAPLPLSPGLGAGIAGRPISLRFQLRG